MEYQSAVFLAAYGTREQLPVCAGPEVVFSGRSNVGKSSAINRIFYRKSLARTSSMPGKTTTINFFAYQDAFFVDLPGYGYAKRSQAEKLRWSRLIEGYFAQERDIRLVIQLIDLRHPPTEDDRMMIDFLIDGEFPFVLLLTKCDKLSRRELEQRLSRLHEEIPNFSDIISLPFSAVTGEGVEQLHAILEDVLCQEEE